MTKHIRKEADGPSRNKNKRTETKHLKARWKRKLVFREQHNINKRDIQHDSPYETSINLILKPAREVSKKVKKNDRSILPMKIDTKILNNILSSKIQKCIKYDIS